MESQLCHSPAVWSLNQVTMPALGALGSLPVKRARFFALLWGLDGTVHVRWGCSLVPGTRRAPNKWGFLLTSLLLSLSCHSDSCDRESGCKTPTHTHTKVPKGLPPPPTASTKQNLPKTSSVGSRSFEEAMTQKSWKDTVERERERESERERKTKSEQVRGSGG